MEPKSTLPIPIELSFSRIQAYQRCPWMYHLVYDLGWHAGPKAASSLGHSLHRALASYLSAENPEKTLNRLLEIYDQHWVNEGFSNVQAVFEAYERGKQMLVKFFEMDSQRKTEVVAVEKEFISDLGNEVRFRATLDRLDRHPDGTLEIIEYKTEKESWPPSRIQSDLQMTLYQIMIEEALKPQSAVKIGYWFLSTGERVYTERSVAQKEAARKLLYDAAAEIRGGNFGPNFEFCGRCPFGRRCAHYRPPSASNAEGK